MRQPKGATNTIPWHPSAMADSVMSCWDPSSNAGGTRWLGSKDTIVAFRRPREEKGEAHGHHLHGGFDQTPLVMQQHAAGSIRASLLSQPLSGGLTVRDLVCWTPLCSWNVLLLSSRSNGSGQHLGQNRIVQPNQIAGTCHGVQD